MSLPAEDSGIDFNVPVMEASDMTEQQQGPDRQVEGGGASLLTLVPEQASPLSNTIGWPTEHHFPPAPAAEGAFCLSRSSPPSSAQPR